MVRSTPLGVDGRVGFGATGRESGPRKEGGVQRVVGGFVAKQVKDMLLAPPRQPAAEVDETVDGGDVGLQVGAEAGADEGEFTDEEGRPLGTAFLVPVAVWVVAERRGERWEELERCLAEPGSRLFIQRERGKVATLIYAGDPARPPRERGEGLRAEDV